MMLRFRSSRAAGFTLVELAIVVGITGLLFSGLWRLMSSGNAQLREQAAADQISQLAGATRSFLASPQGQAMLTAPAAPAVIPLALPLAATPAGNAGCAAALGDPPPSVGIGAYCNFLPAGFSVATVNSYNQTYIVVARKLDGAATVAPQNFDFMIETTGGDVIPDNSGGRISANIGASGGFIYGAATCGAVTNACGAFGGFAFNPAAAAPAGFGAAAPGAGHIVTLNSKGGEIGANGNWLARQQIPGDVAFVFNTMTEDLRLGGNVRDGARVANLDLMAPAGPFATSGRINLRTGVINLNDGLIATDLVSSAINLDNGTVQGPGYVNLDFSGSPIAGTPLVANTRTATTVQTAASMTGPACDVTVPGPPCTPTLLVSGSLVVAGAGNTGGLGVTGNSIVSGTATSGSFIYSSDLRLKKDIVPLAGALDKITQLHGYTFRWREDGREDIGVVAQDVQKVFPQLVRPTGLGDNLGVEYGNLIAPMIEAIKELKAQNATLRARLDAQQRALEELRSQTGH